MEVELIAYELFNMIAREPSLKVFLLHSLPQTGQEMILQLHIIDYEGGGIKHI